MRSPKNRAAGVGTGGVNRNDADGLAGFAVLLGKLVHQGALACSGSAGHADDARVPGVRKQRFEQIEGFGRAVLDRGDGARQGAGIAGANA